MSGHWAPRRERADPAPPRLTVGDYLQGILAHNRGVLARAITLIESSRADHQEMARELINAVLPYAGKSMRIGMTGVPGAGKSALIERFGGFLTERGHRVAVLSIDPSSARSGGSLLGDKTRMIKLSTDPNAFIRPSPSGLVLGGIARQTRETMLLCEAGGHDIVLIETVGVGQSEVTVAEMTDFLLVLMVAGAGDELQGIKRGLLELADLIAITKADGQNVIPARQAAAKYAYAMTLLADPDQGMAPVVTCSALEGSGVEEIWKIISSRTAERERSGYQKRRRSEQDANWMWSLVNQHMHDVLQQDPAVSALANDAAAQVRAGALSPVMAFGPDHSGAVHGHIGASWISCCCHSSRAFPIEPNFSFLEKNMSQLPFPVLAPEEAAAMIEDTNTIGFGGFTPAGCPKLIPRALARRAEAEHEAGRPFKVRVLTGASTGASVDGELAKADAISFRAPYQGNPILRKKINSGDVHYVDMHLSILPQQVRYGFFGKVDYAIVEAVDVTPGGAVVLSSSVGAANTYMRMADKILIEINSHHPQGLLGMHDIFEPQDPPARAEFHVYRPSDRIGSPVCLVDPAKIAGIVMTSQPDETGGFDPSDEVTERIGQNVTEFLVDEMRAGRIPDTFLPLQSGVGNIANAVLGALGRNNAVPPFEMYTEVLQDSCVPLIEAGRVKFASTTAMTLSPETSKHVYDNLKVFRNRILMRPQEISNNPEIVRRLGIISMNTAIEADLGGSVNSSHIMGRQMMNGIGGSGDFTRSAYISIFSCPSTQKGGKISTIVPVVSHMDHSEHSVQVLVTEHGVADLRGKDPKERARIIIDNCAAPEYRDQLNDYLAFVRTGHEQLSFRSSFAMHHKFAQDGDMHGVAWAH